MTYSYRAPERLERDYEAGEKTPADVMVEELSDDIDNLLALFEAGADMVPVQGRVSDYKSWLAAAAAVRLQDGGNKVTLLSPQTANRESGVFKLRYFGAEFLEHAGRSDLCIWEPWIENGGRVDKSTCESIGCPYYVDDGGDVAERAADGIAAHLMENGAVELDTESFREMGSEARQDACPAQLYLASRGNDRLADSVNAATYAKLFADAAVAEDDPLDSDVVLLDEAHTVAGDVESVSDDVDPDSLLSAMVTIRGWLSAQGGRWARRAADDIETLHQSISVWLDESWDGHADPDSVFAGQTVSLGDSFDTVDRIDSRTTQEIRRRMRERSVAAAEPAREAHNAAGEVRSFLSRVKAYRNGHADFVHSLYQQDGDTINEMAFRPVDETVAGGTSAGAVFEEWAESGTHPVIADRWGPILDAYIRALWDGREVRTTNDRPGAPVAPLDKLREVSGADSVVTLSATHNELSDPTRDEGELRATRHKLLTAPVYLRADGSDRSDYDGRDSVSPETPWFRSLVRASQEASGDSLAVVPINFANRDKWAELPVESLDVGGREVPGIVPHSRGSIGEKGLEQMEIDTVMCGVQVQSPAPTALRLVRWWELLAPRRNDPAGVLETSWKLLAQHAVSGTIQAGGRFDWGAVNLVFERPGLFELAGFETEPATPDSPGFAGEFCRRYGDAEGRWSRERDEVRGAKVVRYLLETDGRSATANQAMSETQRIYDYDYEQARTALRRAVESGRVVADEGPRNTKLRLNDD